MSTGRMTGLVNGAGTGCLPRPFLVKDPLSRIKDEGVADWDKQRALSTK